MFIDKDSLVVDGIKLGEYVTEVKYGFNKIWAEDSGRNLAGTQSGTLIGIFPKLEVAFKKLTREELEKLAPILDKATQNVTYYDPVKKKLYTMSTYTGDWATLNRNTFENVARANEDFSISFIARKKRV